MSKPVRTTYMGLIHKGYCEAALEILKGEPVLIENAEGHQVPLIGHDGRIVRKFVAASLREVREFLKDNHIDEEAIETSGIVQVAKAISHYDDEADPLLDDR